MNTSFYVPSNGHTGEIATFEGTYRADFEEGRPVLFGKHGGAYTWRARIDSIEPTGDGRDLVKFTIVHPRSVRNEDGTFSTEWAEGPAK